MQFGYARVSAKDQHFDTQLEQFKAVGVERLFQEQISGTTTQRPVLTELLATLRAGATVTVARLNRLGRNSAHIMQVVADLHARQVRFVALGLGIDTATPAGRLVLGIFAALADYDRESMRERAMAGIALAKAQGKYLCRRAGVDAAKLAKVQASLAAGMSVHNNVVATGVSDSSVKRYRRQLAP